MSNDLEYSLGLDVTPMQRASASIVKFGDDTVKVLNRKFSGADLFRGILQGIGIASVQQIADKLIEPFKAAAESAQRIAGYSDEAANATERMLMARKNDLEQLEEMEKKLAKILREKDAPEQDGFWKKHLKGTSLGRVLGFFGAEAITNEDANAEKRAKAAADAARVGAEIDAKRAAIEDKRYEQEVRNSKLRADYVKDHREELELEAKSLSGRILPAEQARLDILRLQNKEKAIDERISNILEKFPEQRTAEEKRTLVQLERQQGVIEKQIDLKQQVIDATKAQANAEAQIGTVIESNIAKWEEFKGLINSVGRGDSDLTERELQRKIDTINADLANRQNQRAGAYLGAAGTGNYDLIGESLRGSLAQLLAEQRLREETRRNNAIFGPDRAFQMFGGTEQRFAEIISGQRDEFHRLNDGLDVLNRQLQQGVRTAVFTEGAT